jgi:cytochrome c2
MIRKRVIDTCRPAHRGASLALALLALIASSAVLPSQANGEGGHEGQTLFQKRCTGCHALDGDHEGPRLRGVVGRMAGKVENFQVFGAASNRAIHVGRSQTVQVAN